MKVHWQIDDGYAGRARPQCTEIPDKEIEELDEEEIQKVIEEYVDDDFKQKIRWYIINIER